MPENPVWKMSHHHPAFRKARAHICSVTSGFLESAPSIRAMGFSPPGLALASAVEWRRLSWSIPWCRKARFSGHKAVVVVGVQPCGSRLPVYTS